MKKTHQGFTLLELLFCVLGTALLLAPAISLLANNRSESQRTICFNNLKQIGRAFQIWANDHNDANPTWVPPSGGGLQGTALAGNAWYQFTAISNQLGSPKLLVCPADSYATKIADGWGNLPNGFLNVQYRGNALSYALFLHGSPQDPRSILCSDNNFHASGANMTCSSGINNAIGLYSTDPNVGWTNAVHRTSGHLLFNDGSALFSSSSEFRSAVNRFSDTHHVLKPR